ncbi:YqzE family protein [Cohnella faecalis]|uniref:YqzE family protein n=1 Tax=Cohnella faecalis TaxID=2315694 RepID=A0A398CKH1_9BACL|nr:YqzE family protein [Cohnella faecalis]RIE00387.1 YqzE family protein [Cohnella faecalis]
MSDGSDLLKYVTQRVVTYMDTPAEGQSRKERRKRKEPWATRWFGQLLPLGISLWWNGRKRNKPYPPARLVERELD